MSDTTITPEIDLSDPILDEGDHDKFAHYAPKAAITESMVTGKPVVALCGKVWVPTRDPNNYPVCPTCKEIYEAAKAAGR